MLSPVNVKEVLCPREEACILERSTHRPSTVATCPIKGTFLSLNFNFASNLIS